jgi:hypothetical protein
MRASFFLSWLALFGSVVFAQQVAVPELAAVRDPYTRNMTLIRTAREQRAEPITKAYLTSLERLDKQAASDPLLASALTSERARLAAKTEPIEHERKAMPPALAELRTRYEKDLERSNAPFVQQEQQMTRQYITALDVLQRRLAAQNEVAKAAAVHAESVAAAGTLPHEAVSKTENLKGNAESTIRASTVKAVGALDSALAAKIVASTSAKTFTRTENSDADSATLGWNDFPETGGLLVGFEFFEVGKEHRIRSLRPYYMTPEGIVPGKDRGRMEKVTNKIIARAGYAVAGVITNEGKRGMQVIFMKIDPAAGHFATDSSSTYKSTWFGDKGREKPKQIGGTGKFVIGVYGKTGADCDNLGLLELN